MDCRITALFEREKKIYSDLLDGMTESSNLNQIPNRIFKDCENLATKSIFPYLEEDFLKHKPISEIQAPPNGNNSLYRPNPERVAALEIAKELGLPVTQFDSFEELAAACFGFRPFLQHAVVIDRPDRLNLDDFYRFHSESGPAVRFPSGFSIYSIHGVIVPEKVACTPESLTVEEVGAEENAEVRRVMIERFPGGPAGYAETAGAKCIDRDFRKRHIADKAPAPRALFEFPDSSKWLVGTDGSTDRSYWMPVHQDAKTCRDAHQAIVLADETQIIAES